ncbi:hypothetical protein [Nonomuraea recticatena]|uniref:TrwC relaxase domain-containing protein n=1 Tax=Nonomuraea recticatena TaxID=46178 RepID=A0ABN3TCA4_9ACTN
MLYGLADAEFAAAIKGVFADAVVETVAAVEGWAAYGQRGHQDDGQRAERMDSTGLLAGPGDVAPHGPPGQRQPPDPPLHAHVAIANMARGPGREMVRDRRRLKEPAFSPLSSSDCQPLPRPLERRPAQGQQQPR